MENSLELLIFNFNFLGAQLQITHQRQTHVYSVLLNYLNFVTSREGTRKSSSRNVQ